MQLLSFFDVILFLSFLALLIPSISYARDSFGFQGILNHPQGFGIIMAPYCGYLSYILLSKKKVNLIDIGLFFLSLTSIFLSKARIGLISIIAGYLILIIFLKIKNKKIPVRVSRRLYSFLGVFIISFVFLDLPVLNEFFIKKSETSNVSDAFLISRGLLIAESLENINNNPFFGIGFGIAESETRVFTPSGNGLFVMSAPTEKPFLLLAVLEEVGIFSFIVFLMFFYHLLKQLIFSTKNLAFSLASLIAISTNIAEMTFFSMGGLGVFVWMAISVGLEKNE
jgi:hypothetical protein